MTTRITLKGDTAMIAALGALEQKVRKKAARKAITQAVKPIVSAYRANVPVRYGLLKKAIGSKIKSSTRSERRGQIFGIVGARADRIAMVTNEKTGKQVKVNPSKYQHLVEFGTKAHTIKLGKVKIPHPGSRGTAPLRRAVESTRGEVMSIIASTIAEAVASRGS